MVFKSISDFYLSKNFIKKEYDVDSLFDEDVADWVKLAPFSLIAFKRGERGLKGVQTFIFRSLPLWINMSPYWRLRLSSKMVF